jgi:predicted esterase
LIQKEEESGVPSQNIFVGGFSQGAMMGLNGGITYPKVNAKKKSKVNEWSF